jgi:two-component system OmpR family sensor kinase
MPGYGNSKNKRMTLRQRYLRVPLRVRLTVWYTVILSVALVAFSLFTYVTVSNSLHSNMDVMLTEVSRSVDVVISERIRQSKSETGIQRDSSATNVGTAASQKPDSVPARPPKSKNVTTDTTGIGIDNLSFEELSTLVSQGIFTRSGPSFVFMRAGNFFVQFADLKGNVYWRSENLRDYSLPTYTDVSDGMDAGQVFLEARLNKQSLRVLCMRGSVSELSVGYSIQEVDEILRQLRNTFEIGFSIALVFAVVIGYLLARYSLQQVDIITNAAKRITAENLSKRLPLPVTNDEIARLTTTLNAMIARLDISFTQVRQFTSDVSHELRTPLAILMGELELALRNEMEPDDYHALVVSALEEVMRLSKMVSSLLEISRAETGQVRLQKALFDISKVVTNICDDMQILAEDKSITLETDIQPYVTIVADESRLHQMLINVIDNAIKYTPRNGSVKVSLSTRGSQTKIEISDTGVGISEEDQSFIFNRFYRVDQSRSNDVVGSGLGLSIVRWIVEAHQGTIKVKSELGEGSTFTIILPYETT